MGKAVPHQELLIDLSKIDPPVGQVRLEIPQEEIEELAESINAIGQLQAILVRPVGDRFEIVFGHRRFLACTYLGHKTLRGEAKELTDQEVALMRATENVARRDLSLIEEAAVYADLRDTHSLTANDIAKLMGKSAGIVHRRLDLLKMPPQLQKAIHTKQISYSVAEELWSLGDETAIDYYLAFSIENGATQAVVRGWVKDWKDGQRRREPGTGGTGGLQSPHEPRPIYVPCDVCLGSMNLGTEIIIRVCPNCNKLIREAVKQPD